MNRLQLPMDTMELSFGACSMSVNDDSLNARMDSAWKEILWHADEYQDNAKEGELYKSVPIHDSVLDDPIVVGRLSKGDLVRLYAYHMVQREPGRNVYDRIMVSADGRCPYCSGLGSPRNLDHYLPKSSFPQYSVLPSNLIPCCRDCNMDGKGPGFAKSAEKQVIHPYLDKPHFFEEQWLFAEYHPDENVGVISYFARPPSCWNEVDKERVRTHFSDFLLARRFSDAAAVRLVFLIPQVRTLIAHGLSDGDINECIFQPVTHSPNNANHWERVMYLALMKCSWR